VRTGVPCINGASDADPATAPHTTDGPTLTTERIHLKRPAATEPRQLLARYFVPIVTVHLLALLVFVPALFSWTGVILCVAGVHVFGQTITMGYHRLLAHRSFATPLWFEHVLVVGALCCLEDSPARWIATHRMHHAHSDEEDDPHTPLVTFLWGHLWWILVRNRELHHRTNYDRYARDILRDPFYMWIEKNAWSPLWFYMAQVAVYAAAGFGAALLWTDAVGAAWFAASVVVWGVYARTVLVWHITWSVNSLTHLFGYRNHDTEENSRNNWVVALFAAGEGWHNNHHADPACCTVQHRWWEVDVTYWELRALSLVGLTSQLNPRREVRAAEAVARAQAARVQAKPTNSLAAGESAVAGIAAAAAGAGVGNRSQAVIQASPGSSNT
jgi:stearoyl-CoA desaturase (delta-9 desaturase)